jgi:hypothetical protein
MSIKSELEKIFPNIPNIFEEANKKLTNVHLFIDNKLHHIKEWCKDYAICYNKKTGDTYTCTGNKISLWLPRAGIYPLSNGNFVLLTKIPKRQWCRSYSELFYSFATMGSNKGKVDVYEEISTKTPIDIYIDPQKFIWWWDIKIGYIKNSKTVVCTDKEFVQEIKDWLKV